MMNKIQSLKDSGFKVTEETISGELCYFIRPPNMGITWTKDNLIYRSSIWNSNFEPVSLGYPKFFNFAEQPEIHPFTHQSLSNCSIMEKLDGSCLIVSKYKDEIVMRTRGTISADIFPNVKELKDLKEKITNIFKDQRTVDQSYIFEWCSPNNIIILKYSNEPEFYLTNVINHRDYSLYTQDRVDEIAKIYGFNRPRRYRYYQLDSLLHNIKDWIDSEGVVLYYDNDQHMRKIKSNWYLNLHFFKGKVSLKSMLNLYFDWNEPNKDEFKKNVELIFDYECLKMSDSLIDELYKKLDEYNDYVSTIRIFCQYHSNLSDKEFSKICVETYGKDSGIAFSLRKGNDMSRIKRKRLESLIKDI